MAVGWDTIRPAFLYLTQAKPTGPIHGVEIGVDFGENTGLMLDCCERLFLDLVEIKPMSKEVEVYCEIGRAKYHQLLSIEAAKTFPDNHFDFIYIDAEHDYVNVMLDLNAWWPKVKTGGVFSGHDFWDDRVRKAVYDFFRGKHERVYGVVTIDYNEGPICIPTMEGQGMDWWLRKS